MKNPMLAVRSQPDPPEDDAVRAPLRVRRTALGVSLVLAIALNLVALGVFGAVVGGWQSAPVETPHTLWITSVKVEPHATPQSTPESHAGADPRADPIPSLPRIEIADWTKETGLPPETAAPMEFYGFGEVDQPAVPDSDWNLDTAVLDIAGLERLVFEIFVSHTGEVVGCTILEPDVLAEETRQMLEDRLRQTVLQPAVRAGVAVASVRRIELSVLSPTD